MFGGHIMIYFTLLFFYLTVLGPFRSALRGHSNVWRVHWASNSNEQHGSGGPLHLGESEEKRHRAILMGTDFFFFFKQTHVQQFSFDLWSSVLKNQWFLKVMQTRVWMLSFCAQQCAVSSWTSLLCQQVFRMHTDSSHSNSVDKTYSSCCSRPQNVTVY